MVVYLNIFGIIELGANVYIISLKIVINILVVLNIQCCIFKYIRPVCIIELDTCVYIILFLRKFSILFVWYVEMHISSFLYNWIVSYLDKILHFNNAVCSCHFANIFLMSLCSRRRSGECYVLIQIQI